MWEKFSPKCPFSLFLETQIEAKTGKGTTPLGWSAVLGAFTGLLLQNRRYIAYHPFSTIRNVANRMTRKSLTDLILLLLISAGQHLLFDLFPFFHPDVCGTGTGQQTK